MSYKKFSEIIFVPPERSFKIPAVFSPIYLNDTS